MRRSIYVAAPSFNDEHALARLSEFGIVCRASKEHAVDSETLRRALSEHDALIIGIRHRLPAELHSTAHRARIICTLSSGTEHIAPVFFDDPQWTVLRTAQAPGRAVGEHALTLALCLARRLPHTLGATRRGVDRNELGVGRSLLGRNIGVLGAGPTARSLLTFTAPLCARQLCFTPNPRAHRDLESLGVELAELDAVLEQSDVLSIHLPLRETTRGLLDDRALRRLPAGALVVNTARAAIVDSAALFDAVVQGRLGGAAIDDFPTEIACPIPAHPNLIVTPHIATRTAQCMAAMQREAAELVVSALSALAS